MDCGVMGYINMTNRHVNPVPLFSQILANKYLTVPTGSLSLSTLNPAIRTADGPLLDDLQASIIATQTIAPLVVCVNPYVPGGYIAINGGRRLTVALRLNLPKLPIMLVEGNPVILWALHNQAQCTVGGAQMWTAWTNCNHADRETLLAHMSKDTAKYLRQIVALIGVAAAERYGSDGTHSPSIIKSVSKIQTAARLNGVTTLTRKGILTWLLDCAMNKTMASQMKTKDAIGTILWKEIAKKIDSNTGFTFALDPKKEGKLMLVSKTANQNTKQDRTTPEIVPDLLARITNDVSWAAMALNVDEKTSETLF